MSDVRPSGAPPSNQANPLGAWPGSSRFAFAARSAARRSANSWGVINALPAYLAGRSSGVVVLLDQEPCKSGSPQGVRHFFAAAAFPVDGALLAGAWAAAGTAAS